MNQELYATYKQTTNLNRTPLEKIRIQPEAVEPAVDALLGNYKNYKAEFEEQTKIT